MATFSASPRMVAQRQAMASLRRQNSSNASSSTVIQLGSCVGKDEKEKEGSGDSRQPSQHEKDTQTGLPTFESLPPKTIAIAPNGNYVVCLSDIGVTDGFKGFAVYDAQHKFLGNWWVNGHEDKDYVGYSDIRNEAGVGGAKDMVAWYLCRYSAQEYMEVHSIVNEDLLENLRKHHQMEDHDVDHWLRQRSSIVYNAARERLLSLGWKLLGE